MLQATALLGPTIGKGSELETFSCARHGNYLGRAFEIAGKKREPICPICMVEQNQAAAEKFEQQLASQQRTSLAQLLGHSGIPPRFMKRGFDTYDASTNDQVAALDVAKTYALNFDSMREAGRGLLFIGTTGTGKTHLTTAICKSVIRDGYSAFFTSVKEVMDLIKESFRRESEMSEREAIARFLEPDLLALDEVGVQYKTDTEQTLLTQIVNKRYEHMKPTILLSNLPPKATSGDSLATVLGERIISRLKEVSDTVVCDWEDYRARTR